MNMSPDISTDLHSKISEPELFEFGFVRREFPDLMDVDWVLTTPEFEVMIDVYGVVHLSRRDPDSDPITVWVGDKYDMQMLVDWVQPTAVLV